MSKLAFSSVWSRVGYIHAPLKFMPRELYEWNRRYDDLNCEFRTIYFAKSELTCLREVLADFRPKASVIDDFMQVLGKEAVNDIPSKPITAAWRRQHVLVDTEIEIPQDAPVIELTNPSVRQKLEMQHAALLAEHGFQHLDLSEITTDRRKITQTIASDAYRRLEALGVQFPSKHDGRNCLAVFERPDMQSFELSNLTRLTDPAPPALRKVCEEWNLELEPAFAV